MTLEWGASEPISLLHIKLMFMKNVVKAMDKSGPRSVYLKTKFPHISDAKIKEGHFKCDAQLWVRY